jgi:hypothetical protein
MQNIFKEIYLSQTSDSDKNVFGTKLACAR